MLSQQLFHEMPRASEMFLYLSGESVALGVQRSWFCFTGNTDMHWMQCKSLLIKVSSKMNAYSLFLHLHCRWNDVILAHESNCWAWMKKIKLNWVAWSLLLRCRFEKQKWSWKGRAWSPLTPVAMRRAILWDGHAVYLVHMNEHAHYGPAVTDTLKSLNRVYNHK